MAEGAAETTTPWITNLVKKGGAGAGGQPAAPSEKMNQRIIHANPHCVHWLKVMVVVVLTQFNPQK